MILTASQVVQFALGTGFSPATAAIAVAIAHAESGFNDQAIGDVSLMNDVWGPSVGLWQIRTLKEQTGSGLIRDIEALKDPSFQAYAAFRISSNGTSFAPWSTYMNGAYKRYMGGAVTAVNSAIANQSGAQMPTPASTIVAFEPTPSGQGYWFVFSDGAVFGFGDAHYFGRPQLDANGVWQPIQ